jgi:hypothetical protein
MLISRHRERLDRAPGEASVEVGDRAEIQEMERRPACRFVPVASLCRYKSKST